MRKLIAVAVALAVVSTANAEEVKGKVKKVDADKSVVVITNASGMEVEYAVEKDAKITQAPLEKAKAKKKRPVTPSELTGGLKSVKDDAKVVLTTEKKDGKDVVTALKVEAGEKAKKKKKDK